MLGLQAHMAGELRLSSAQFKEFVQCGMDREKYAALMTKKVTFVAADVEIFSNGELPGDYGLVGCIVRKLLERRTFLRCRFRTPVQPSVRRF